ncbi:hypothetical protein C5167_011717 [Papaver somniferum]|uniref:Dienelactone hydrolase domain-containing protein n=1 Tax=Papaver somniferum TaxID=3469 RepID=A0A4Y7K7N6_PAPSO|nr:hypothetical protein C5167_011717 [Papaver somniferum]
MVEIQCCQNPPDLSLSSGCGRVEEIGGLQSYVSGSSDSKPGIFLVSDAFGNHPALILDFLLILQCYLMTDNMVLTKSELLFFFLWISLTSIRRNFFRYEAPNLSQTYHIFLVLCKRNLADKVAAAGFYVVVPDFFHGDPYTATGDKVVWVWLEFHGTDVGTEDAKTVIGALKDTGISAVGAAGMCCGGKVVGELAKSDDLKAIVMMHPGLVTVDDIKELVKQVVNKEAVKHAEEAHADMFEWLSKYVKAAGNF